MARIAIHGFGRIGRSLMKAALRNNLFTPVSISDIKDIPTLAALFEVDYQLRPLARRGHSAGEQASSSAGARSPTIDSMKELPDWGALGVDLVIDCTGRATTRAGAQAHLDRGAKRVLVSAPSKTLDGLRRGPAAGHQPRALRPGAAQDRQHGELHHQRAGAGGQGACWSTSASSTVCSPPSTPTPTPSR